MSMRSTVKVSAALVIATATAFLCGFAWFVWQAEQTDRPPPHADGIVVLTGGADRVDAGLHLLMEGHARLLLVSGAAPHAALPGLARLAGLDPRPLRDAVTLGHEATTTRGNAVETASWARRNDIRSLIVVTAGYHMPRALAELHRQMPDVTLYAASVQPPALRTLASFSTMRLLMSEYVKWLGAEAGLSRMEPLHEAAEHMPGAHG